jgi:predicted lipid-binding transport protein (Tim44 family)
MSRNLLKILAITVALFCISVTVFEMAADARGGGGRSMGSRGSRSYSPPGQSASPWGQQRQQTAPPPSNPAPYQQPSGGGFLRSFGGGLLGGLMGGMLFRSLGFGGFGGGGFGLLDVVILFGIGYFIYSIFIKRGKGDFASRVADTDTGYQETATPYQGYPSQTMSSYVADLDQGLSQIKQTDLLFDETRFKDTVMDIFFKVQSAWMNRDLTPIHGLLTDEMLRIFQSDIDQLLRDKKVNRLENIAVRNVAIVEAWQETEQDYITVLFYANLLDYTTSDTTGEVVSGSKTEPVKFEEYWTVTRAAGNYPWKLSAINQK